MNVKQPSPNADVVRSLERTLKQDPAALDPALAPVIARRIVDAIDTNKDGAISWNEKLAMTKAPVRHDVYAAADFAFTPNQLARQLDWPGGSAWSAAKARAARFSTAMGEVLGTVVKQPGLALKAAVQLLFGNKNPLA